MPTHVSLHDVSPAWAPEVDAALALCRAAGVRPALLVVPNYHRRAALAQDPPFAARLRELQQQGHEVYLHGLYHRSVERGPTTSRLSWLFSQRVVSSGEAELVGLTLDEAVSRLDAGARALADAGLRVDGYVPPAWSMPRSMFPLLASRGIRYTEDHLRVYDPIGGRSRASLVLNWASRTPARLLSTVGFCRAAGLARGLVPTRIAIHPADMGQLLLRREIERALRHAAGDFVARGTDLLGGG